MIAFKPLSSCRKEYSWHGGWTGETSGDQMGGSENGGFSPQIIHFNRVFHFNHPFWGTPIFGNTQINMWDFWPKLNCTLSFSKQTCTECLLPNILLGVWSHYIQSKLQRQRWICVTTVWKKQDPHCTFIDFIVNWNRYLFVYLHRPFQVSKTEQ